MNNVKPALYEIPPSASVYVQFTQVREELRHAKLKAKTSDRLISILVLLLSVSITLNIILYIVLRKTT